MLEQCISRIRLSAIEGSKSESGTESPAKNVGTGFPFVVPQITDSTTTKTPDRLDKIRGKEKV